MKNLVCLFVLALAFTGCSTEDDANVPAGLLKRKKHIGFVPQENYNMRYYYNGHKLDRTESNNGEREIYYYDGDLIVNVKLYDETSLEKETRYQYDGSGRLIGKHVIRHDNDWNEKSLYAYNNDGTVTETRYGFQNENPEELQYTRQFFFDSGEVTQEIVTWPDGNSRTTAYTYDDKLVPEHGITGFEKIRLLEPEAFRGVYHNIVDVTVTYSNLPDVETYSHIWTYNEQGAPSGFEFGEGTTAVDAGSFQYFYK